MTTQIQLNDIQLKEVFFNQLFEQRVIKYPTERDGKFIDVVYQCNNESLHNFINKLYSKYKIKHSFTDYMSECMYWTNIAIQRFNIRDDSSWTFIIAGTDRPNIGKLISNIKTTIENEIIKFNNPDTKWTTKREGSANRHVAYKYSFTSLDQVLMDTESNTTSLIQTISSDKTYWMNKEGYMMNEFIKWFLENKEDILLKSQIRFLNNLEKCQHEKDGYTENDIAQVTGVPHRLIGTYLQRIKDRVEKAWSKEKQTGRSIVQMSIDAEVNMWDELTDIMYCEDENIQAQAQNFTYWIKNHLEEDTVSNIIADGFNSEETQSIVKAFKDNTTIPNILLYKFQLLVEDRLHKLTTTDTTATPFYKKQSEMGKYTSQAHKEYNNSLQDFKHQPCHVYDLQGNFKETVPYKTSPNKSKTIFYQVSPAGVHTELETSN
ncbi:MULTISPECIES: hypothetical protein [Gammaproteobacteria]|uniref:hypothetical protein n=1 Tax=Acinetobacter sp. HRXRD-152 TaxID=3404808 RepID=UPI003BB7DBA3